MDADAAPAAQTQDDRGDESLIRSRIVPVLGRRHLGELRASDVQGWVNGMIADGISASRIRQATVVLNKALEAAARDGKIAASPARDVDLPSLPRAEAQYRDAAFVDAIASEASPPYDLAVRILGTLGLRFSEMAALRRGSVDVLRRRLHITESLAEIGGTLSFGPTKTHAARWVPLPPTIAMALARRLEQVAMDPSALVFTSPNGRPLRHSAFRSRVWLPALRRAGAEHVGIHALRHSAAALMIHSGASPKEVQSVLGHRSAAFTLTVYGHLFDADLDAMADRLDAALAIAQTGPGRDRRSAGAVVKLAT